MVNRLVCEKKEWSEWWLLIFVLFGDRLADGWLMALGSAGGRFCCRLPVAVGIFPTLSWALEPPWNHLGTCLEPPWNHLGTPLEPPGGTRPGGTDGTEASYDDFLGLDLHLVGEQQLLTRLAEPQVEEVNPRSCGARVAPAWDMGHHPWVVRNGP